MSLGLLGKPFPFCLFVCLFVHYCRKGHVYIIYLLFDGFMSLFVLFSCCWAKEIQNKYVRKSLWRTFQRCKFKIILRYGHWRRNKFPTYAPTQNFLFNIPKNSNSTDSLNSLKLRNIKSVSHKLSYLFFFKVHIT